MAPVSVITTNLFFSKILSLKTRPILSIHVRYCALKMTDPTWKIEKNKILKLSLADKRKLYKASEYITLDDVSDWRKYVNQLNTKGIELKAHSQEDLQEFKKIQIDTSKNQLLSGKVAVFKGDITKLEVDAIVNAANGRLIAGGGVDGAIHRAAGRLLQDECHTLGGCPTGEAKITGGYNLPANYVIHTVGPQDGSAPKLQSCYEKCLSYKEQYQLNSIAFPCISTGIYGFPNRLAAHIALRTARKFLEENDMERIIFCTFLPIDVDIYETLMQMYFPLSDNVSVSE